MAAKKKEDQHPVAPVIRVAPLGELKVYTVTEEELEAIRRGSPGSIFLNFALALLPLSVGFLVTLLTTAITQVATLVFFISASIICFLVGSICLALAWYHHTSTSQVIERIKNRMPPARPIPQGATDVGTATERVEATKEPEPPPASKRPAAPEPPPPPMPPPAEPTA